MNFTIKSKFRKLQIITQSAPMMACFCALMHERVEIRLISESEFRLKA